jgi:hypothetical protein
LDVTETPAIFQGNLSAVSIRISIFVNDSGARGMRFEPMSVQRVADTSEIPTCGLTHESSFVSYPKLQLVEVDNVGLKQETETTPDRPRKRSKVA